MLQVVLGSQSPRRKEIFNFFDIPFKQAVSHFDEEAVPFLNNPKEYVCQLAKGKAESLAPVYPLAAIVTADTIVFREGKIYGKPKDKEEAYQTLTELSGQWHSVYTGVGLRKGNDLFYQWEETRVLFNTLTSEQIRTYINHYHWADKAGGYGIQMGGGLIIEKIEGCFYNVMGLPINALRSLFLKIGIDLWQHIKR